MDKYIATAMRKNIDGKPDYEWVAKYSNGNTIIFDTEEAAQRYADSACCEPAHGMYAPKAKKIQKC
jgi:hypothetical protein